MGTSPLLHYGENRLAHATGYFGGEAIIRPGLDRGTTMKIFYENAQLIIFKIKLSASIGANSNGSKITTVTI